MYYSIYATDQENSLDARRRARPAHLQRLNELLDQGRLLVSGPNPRIDSPEPGPAGFSGSVIIAEFDSLEEARAWAEDDPYFAAGAYQSVEVKPFKKVLP